MKQLITSIGIRFLVRWALRLTLIPIFVSLLGNAGAAVGELAARVFGGDSNA